MTKCIGRMPECQYFTTGGGCVSPFNCLYKVEGIYSNSATSNTICYAGTSYTEAQADESESGIRKWYRESVGHEPANYDAAALKAYIAHLEAENAELQEKDMKCANSVDEMIAMCDKCGLRECCGCEHSYTAVQEVKELKEAEELKQYKLEDLEVRCEVLQRDVDNLTRTMEEGAEELKEAEHHAEVAERALLVACANAVKDEKDDVDIELLVRVVYDKYLGQAEKELAEEGKDD